MFLLKTFEEAVLSNPTSASLYLMAANYDLQQASIVRLRVQPHFPMYANAIHKRNPVIHSHDHFRADTASAKPFLSTCLLYVTINLFYLYLYYTIFDQRRVDIINQVECVVHGRLHIYPRVRTGLKRP